MLISKNGQSFEYELILKDVKNINLRIKSTGEITVSASKKVSISEVENFLLENFDKILSSQSKFKEKNSSFLKFVDDEIISILGIEYKVSITPSSKNKIYLHGDYIYFAINDLSYDFKLKLFQKFILSISKVELFKMVEDTFTLFDLETFPTVKFRAMKSRWGSCIPAKNQINLSSHLVLQPYNSALYVIIHEFSHFYHPNHSKAFYDFVSLKMPDHLKHKENLKMFF